MDLGRICLVLARENTEVKYYRYRTARVNLVLGTAKIDDSAAGNRAARILNILLKKVDKEIDNHIVFEVLTSDASFAIQYSDGELWIGVGITEERW